MNKTMLTVLAVAALAACGGGEGRLSARQAADAVHAVIEADRTAYAQIVVDRLVEREGVIEASEHWREDKALPLPAQMLREGAARVAEGGGGFSYALLSLWPINDQNAPRTPLEREGLQAVLERPGQPFYGIEELGGKRYFTAVYPDRAVAAACVNCHNAHPDSPRDDFREGEVMGGVVVRLPLADD